MQRCGGLPQSSLLTRDKKCAVYSKKIAVWGSVVLGFARINASLEDRSMSNAVRGGSGTRASAFSSSNSFKLRAPLWTFSYPNAPTAVWCWAENFSSIRVGCGVGWCWPSCRVVKQVHSWRGFCVLLIFANKLRYVKCLGNIFYLSCVRAMLKSQGIFEVWHFFPSQP